MLCSGMFRYAMYANYIIRVAWDCQGETSISYADMQMAGRRVDGAQVIAVIASATTCNVSVVLCTVH
jgi:hypothetical protein